MWTPAPLIPADLAVPAASDRRLTHCIYDREMAERSLTPSQAASLDVFWVDDTEDQWDIEDGMKLLRTDAWEEGIAALRQRGVYVDGRMQNVRRFRPPVHAVVAAMAEHGLDPLQYEERLGPDDWARLVNLLQPRPEIIAQLSDPAATSDLSVWVMQSEAAVARWQA